MGQRVEKDSAEAGGSLQWRLAWSTLGVLGETLTQRKINNNKKRQDCRVVAVALHLRGWNLILSELWRPAWFTEQVPGWG